MATNSSWSTVATSRHLEVTSPHAVVTRNVTSASLASTVTQSTLRIVDVKHEVVSTAAAAADDEDGGGSGGGGDVLSRLVSTAMNVAEGGVTTAEEDTTEMLAPGDVQSSSTLAIAVGVAVTAAVLLIVVITLIFLIIRRRQRRRREKSIMKIENPQYKLPDVEERKLTLEKATLSVAPTVSFKANNNTALINASNTANSRKRKDAPLPPIDRQPPADESVNNKEGKRAAPSPPRDLDLELYEKDSPTVSTEDLTIAHNTNAAISPSDESVVSPSDSSQLKPLITPDSSKQTSRKGAAPTPNWSPKRPPPSNDGETAMPFNSQTIDVDTKRRVSGEQDNEDDIGGADDLSAGENQRVALLGKKAVSNISLDSYDKTKNPFFTGS